MLIRSSFHKESKYDNFQLTLTDGFQEGITQGKSKVTEQRSCWRSIKMAVFFLLLKCFHPYVEKGWRLKMLFTATKQLSSL